MLPVSSSSDGCLLALRDTLRETFRDDWREVWVEVARDEARELSREAALRETVLPLSKIWRRRSGMAKSAQDLGL